MTKILFFILLITNNIASFSENNNHSEKAIDPMHQFNIQTLFDIPLFGDYFSLDFTNSSLFLVITFTIIFFLLNGVSKKFSLIPNTNQTIAEMLYFFVQDIIDTNCGKEGRKYFPLIFSIFLMILISNLVGMIPYSFTVMSHIAITFSMALFMFIYVTAVGFKRYGLGYLNRFIPSGCPSWLIPLLACIEVISYLLRPITLSVRLFANLTGGHAMLKVFAGLAIMAGVYVGWIAIAMMVALTGLEIMVACLQAYIFTIFTCIYLSESLDMHH